METQGANDRQHGGDHYRKRTYQHWDFVCDTSLHYLLGCATKYIARWRDKNGREDLEKAVHYLEKAMERGVKPPSHSRLNVILFTEQLEPIEADIIRGIMVQWDGDYAEAIGAIDLLIGSAE